MKKYLVFLIALFVSAAACAQHGGRKGGSVRVQGQHHEVLTRMKAEGKSRKRVSPVPLQSTYIDPSNFTDCWIDEPGFQKDQLTDSAYLIIRFTDNKDLDSIFVWGYRWNPQVIAFGDTAQYPHHTIDMLTAVANQDQRLTVMLQYTGKLGSTLGGIGMNWTDEGDDCSRVPLAFNLDTAEKYVTSFAYTDTALCSLGQVAVPSAPAAQAASAIAESLATGILLHPFAAQYGRPAYDYDYWSLNPPSDEQHWQSGWNSGFWGFYVADNRRVPEPTGDYSNDPDLASLGISSEPLLNQQVHAFVFEPGFVVHTFVGSFVYPCGCDPCP